MLHTIAKRLEICIDINIEISQVDLYTWILTSRIFRLGGLENFLKKSKPGKTLIIDLRVTFYKNFHKFKTLQEITESI